jgi:hypothetical protein
VFDTASCVALGVVLYSVGGFGGIPAFVGYRNVIGYVHVVISCPFLRELLLRRTSGILELVFVTISVLFRGMTAGAYKRCNCPCSSYGLQRS